MIQFAVRMCDGVLGVMEEEGLIDYLYAEINVAGIVLLLLFLNNMHKNRHKGMPIDQVLFSACIVANVLIFLFDTVMWLVDGSPVAFLGTVNSAVTMLYYISNPLICLLWLMYTDYKIYENRKGLFRRVRFYVVPCAISTVLSVLSLFTGWLYTTDASNTYMRGPYFWVMACAALSYLVLSFGLSLNDIIVNGWRQNKNVSFHLVVFPLGIIAASLLQIMFYGISIIWVCSMVAFASIFINIQNIEISTDHLTGLYNRRRLDEHFLRKQQMRKKNHQLFAIMLDLDDFKNINDRHGHAAGDNALKKAAELLVQVCKGCDDFIARIGGDEFFILGERPETDGIIQLMEKISSAADEYNKRHRSDYLLQPSMGYSVFHEGDTINSFFAAADRAMYENKQKRKQAAGEIN
ncbi:MAG: diguanylate cyclase [Christensenellales bacterium]